MLQHAIDLDGARVKEALDAAWGITRPGPSPYTAEQAGAAVARLRTLRSQWRDLAGDATVDLDLAVGPAATAGRPARAVSQAWPGGSRSRTAPIVSASSGVLSSRYRTTRANRRAAPPG